MLTPLQPTDLIHKDLTTAIVWDPITVPPEVTVGEAIALMNRARSRWEAGSTAPVASTRVQIEARASCAIVVESQKVIGLLTEQDVVRLCTQQQSFNEIPVRQAMTPLVLTLRESAFTDLLAVIHLLQQHHIRHLPIVDEQDCLVGLVTHETLQQVLQPTELLRLLQKEQIIAHLAIQIRSSLSLQTILETAVEHIHQIIGCDRVNIWKFEPDLSTVVVAESTDSPRSLLGERVLDECYQQHITEVYREGYVRVVPDIYTTEMSDCHREFLISLQTRAKILLPLFCGDQLWGLLNVSESQTARDWQVDEVDLLQNLATQLTIAIQQASAHEQLQAELRERQQVEAKLQESKQQYAKLASLAPVGIFGTDANGNCIYVNDRWCQITGLTPDQAMGKGWMQALHPDDRSAVVLEWYASANADRRFQLEYRFLQDNGTVTWVFGQSEHETDVLGNVIGYVGSITEITDRKTAETLLQLRNNLLARVAAQESLSDTLTHVCTLVEGMLDGAICSILLLDNNNQLRDGAAPGLPDHYRHQIDGVSVGEGVGSCGTAVHRQERVIVADIATDPLWRDFKDLALTSGLRACWSTPIVTVEGAVLGTFAVYYREVRSPHAEEVALVDGLVHIVMLAVQRHQNEIALKQTNQRLLQAQRIAHLGHWEYDLQHNTIYWCKEVFRLFELDPQQCSPTYEIFWEFVHPDDRATFNKALSKHLHDHQPFSIVHRLQMPDGRIKYVQAQCETTTSADDGPPLTLQGTVQDITRQQESEMRRERAETSLRQVIEGTAAFTGEAFFPALVRHIAEALCVRYVSVSQATSEGFQVLAFFADGELLPPQFLPYDLVPCCRQALQTGSCCHPSDVQTLYPDNPLFTDLRVNSYLGIGLRNAAGEPTGNLCILHDAPFPDPDWAQTLLSIFATRAGAELERILTAQALKQLNAELEELNAELEELNIELEKRVTQRTAELAEREALLQDFLDNANDLIQIVNIDTGHFEFVNRAWRHILGYTATEVEQLTCFDIIAPDCHSHCQAAFAQMQSGNFTHLDQVELIFIGKFGQTVVVEGNINCRVETLADGNQRPVSTRGIFRDITAKKEAELALQRREARYRALMEGAADAILLADPQGHILEANQRAEGLLGYSLAELTTLHFTQLHPAEELDKVTRSFVEMAQGKRTQILGITCRRQNGTTVPVDITASVIELSGETLVQGIFHDISERKQIETALRESQQFLKTVLDTVPIAVFWKDRASNYLGANQFFLQNAALNSSSELIGKTDFDLPWGATEAEAYRADDRIVMDAGEAKLGIIETQHQQDGSNIWLETNKLPLRNLAGEIVGVLGTYQDITARRSSELVLKRQLAAIEAAIDGIAILQDERYVYLNSSHVELFGYQSTKELIGQSWRGLYSPEELEHFDQAIWPALYEQMYWQGEVIATRKDGTTFPQQLSLTLLVDNLIICVFQDISVRKQEQAALQQKTDELDRFFSLALDLLCIATLDGYFVRLNHQWEKVLGYSLSDLEGSQFMNFVHPEDLESTLQAMQTLEQGKDIIGFTNRYRCWDGSYRWIEWRSAPSGNLVYAAARDITERQQAQNQLTERNYQLAITNTELARATRLKDEFLANMSHELRTPLNAILGMAEGLQDEVFGIVNERQLKALRTIESSASHLLALINDILDVAKIESGQINLERSQVFVEQLCSSSMAFIKQQALKKRIHLQTNLSPHLPNLFVDERRLRQALLNLLTNAVKFTPEGGIITLAVFLLPPETDTDQQPYLRISVTDTGIGIAPENIGKLFQPFVQIDSALNRQYTGTGLGLALVKQIIELHGGQVGLTSELGIGSCFTIDLPYDPNLLPAHTPKNVLIVNKSHLSVANPEERPSMPIPLILLAEDNPANIESIAGYLEAKGYGLLFANNGQEAIDLAMSHHPDVILMDIQMPGMDGIEAIQQIRQQERLREIPIIALTALAMLGDQERCLAAGADYYLSKPVKLKQLDLSIQELLANRSSK